MANEPQKLEGGLFIDTKTGDVVHAPPEEGMQIVPEGGVLDNAGSGLLKAEKGFVEQSDVDAFVHGDALEAVSDDAAGETADDVETVDDKTITTDDVSPKRKR